MSDSSAAQEREIVVVGSGFGGGTVALRLAEAGRRVLVLERGRRWCGANLPAPAEDPPAAAFPELGEPHFFWGRRIGRPAQRRLGLFELRQMRNLQALTAAGVGGGSLIWANVVIEAPEEIFAGGWPSDLTRATLEPYYRRAEEYLRPVHVPGTPAIPDTANGRVVTHSAMLKEGAEKLGLRWSPVRVAINFGDETDPLPNGHGAARQLGCNYCGRCSAGCPQGAKNTVDLTYLAQAQALGAEVHPLTEVIDVEAARGGFRLHFRRYDPDGRTVERGVIRAGVVVLAAGTFGTTQLLLRSRARGLITGLSNALGSRISINGNVLGGGLGQAGKADKEAGIDPAPGPAIASMIDCGAFVIEDFANPLWAGGIVGGSSARRIWSFVRALIGHKPGARKLGSPGDLAVYVGVGRDQARGRLVLNGFGGLRLRWPGGIGNDPLVRELHRAMAELAAAQGRRYMPDIFSVFGRAFTYHPLGGCPMADSAEAGVVDSYGRVFGQENLYVADGSVIPTAIGRNPAFTIAAVAERIAQRIAEEL